MWACISSKDGILRHVHGIVVGFAPTQFADFMVNKFVILKSLPNLFHRDELSFAYMLGFVFLSIASELGTGYFYFPYFCFFQ